MRTKRYWVNRYTDFVEKTLRNNVYKWYSYQIQNEIFTSTLEEVEELEIDQDSVEEMVIFLYLNHELNMLDPIGVYPEVFNEYATYAREMVRSYFKDDKDKFFQILKKQISQMWRPLSFNTDTDTDKDKDKDIHIRCQSIVFRLNEMYEGLMQEADGVGDTLSIKQYWLNQVRIFSSKVLDVERMKFENIATLINKEMEDLLENKERNLEENAEEYVMFLYINHELNRLDYSTIYCAGLPYQYKDFAWKIVKSYKNCRQDEFSNNLKDIIGEMYQFMGYNADQVDRKMSLRIEGILRSIDK